MCKCILGRQSSHFVPAINKVFRVKCTVKCNAIVVLKKLKIMWKYCTQLVCCPWVVREDIYRPRSNSCNVMLDTWLKGAASLRSARVPTTGGVRAPLRVGCALLCDARLDSYLIWVPRCFTFRGFLTPRFPIGILFHYTPPVFSG